MKRIWHMIELKDPYGPLFCDGEEVYTQDLYGFRAGEVASIGTEQRAKILAYWKLREELELVRTTPFPQYPTSSYAERLTSAQGIAR